MSHVIFSKFLHSLAVFPLCNACYLCASTCFIDIIRFCMPIMVSGSSALCIPCNNNNKVSPTDIFH